MVDWCFPALTKKAKRYCSVHKGTYSHTAVLSSVMFGLLQIPRTSQATDGKGVYTVFNIHLNGLYLGSLRYSQLFSLYQEVSVC